MAKRKQLKKTKENEPARRTFSSGCTVLDCVLGGGWAQGKILNVVGDSATGKSLLAIEAAANFIKENPNATILYNDTEAAYDEAYAQSLGLEPGTIVMVEECRTVEATFASLEALIEHQNGTGNSPALYVVDSLDALTSDGELARDFGATNTYGADKPKKLSEMFRKLTTPLANANVTLMIVSQVRDNIGVTFGNKHTRSGGRALQFYSTQIVWLAHIGRLHRTRGKVKRPYGVTVRAQVQKNRYGPPFREALFPIHFSYGVEDLTACLNFLVDTGTHQKMDLSQVAAKKLISTVDGMDRETYDAVWTQAAQATREAWVEIEARFAPKRSKY